MGCLTWLSVFPGVYMLFLIIVLTFNVPSSSYRYGFVEFDDPRDADDAVYDLNGKELCGERVIVEHTKGPRRDGGYGGRSKCFNESICVYF